MAESLMQRASVERGTGAQIAMAIIGVMCVFITTQCGYFNALYNAQQKFDDAQRAEAAGNRGLAVASYDLAIARAAVSYQKYSKSRWADDALLLIGRSHFGRGTNLQNVAPDSQAVAALERLVALSTDRSVRASALAYLGAARTRIGRRDGLAPLDSAVQMTEPESELGNFARFWRARARFDTGDNAGAWQDLDAIAPAANGLGADATIERMLRSIITRDSVRWRAAVELMAGPRGPTMRADSVRALLRRGVTQWGPRYTTSLFPTDIRATLTEEDRLKLGLLHAEILAQAGDTATAIQEGLRVAGASSSETSTDARVRVAQWLLTTARDLSDFPRIRAILVPAFTSGEAVQIIRQIRTIDVLVNRASSDPVAMFVAGEYARDELHTSRVARALFLRMDSLQSRSPYNGKALLAALDISRTIAEHDAVQRRIAAAPSDMYLQGARGAVDSAAFATAETNLRRASVAMRAEAIALAAAGDVSVGRAVALRDSVRLVLQRDSLQRYCVSAIDSLKIQGVRADSSRVACLRRDSARFNAVLRMDTMKLKTIRPDTNATSALWPFR